MSAGGDYDGGSTTRFVSPAPDASMARESGTGSVEGSGLWKGASRDAAPGASSRSGGPPGGPAGLGPLPLAPVQPLVAQPARRGASPVGRLIRHRTPFKDLGSVGMQPSDYARYLSGASGRVRPIRTLSDARSWLETRRVLWLSAPVTSQGPVTDAGGRKREEQALEHSRAAVHCIADAEDRLEETHDQPSRKMRENRAVVQE